MPSVTRISGRLKSVQGHSSPVNVGTSGADCIAAWCVVQHMYTTQPHEFDRIDNRRGAPSTSPSPSPSYRALFLWGYPALVWGYTGPTRGAVGPCRQQEGCTPPHYPAQPCARCGRGRARARARGRARVWVWARGCWSPPSRWCGIPSLRRPSTS